MQFQNMFARALAHKCVWAQTGQLPSSHLELTLPDSGGGKLELFNPTPNYTVLLNLLLTHQNVFRFGSQRLEQRGRQSGHRHSQELHRPGEPGHLHAQKTTNIATAHKFEAWLVGTKTESYCIGFVKGTAIAMQKAALDYPNGSVWIGAHRMVRGLLLASLADISPSPP